MVHQQTDFKIRFCLGKLLDKVLFVFGAFEQSFWCISVIVYQKSTFFIVQLEEILELFIKTESIAQAELKISNSSIWQQIPITYAILSAPKNRTELKIRNKEILQLILPQQIAQLELNKLSKE